MSSSLHDAELASVRIDRTAATVDLGFRHVDGSIVDFSFAGVIGLRINDALLQNVVYRIFVVPSDPLPREEIRRILSWMFSLNGRLTFTDQTLEIHVADVLAGNKTLFYVERSWGAEIGVLCATVVRSDAGGA